ncbi:MAG TPA: PilT/PilU family type 4a pilus ATPase [Candidatus Paceibacterota bacterium]|nr:PilT/PilU family type 4a pilus ATPase [Candidatus Paceibacterota bacterium]
MDYQKLLEELITITLQENASDLHLATDRAPVIRVANQLIAIVKQPVLKNEDVLGFLNILLDKPRVDRFREEQEIDFAYDFKNQARLRGNAFFQKGKIGVALRVIPKVRSLAELNLPQVLETFARRQQGFFLIVGPVGSGKSTTLAAIIDLINKERAEHIITIEDPIEYIFEAKQSIIDQREVGIDTRDFDHALTAAFRQDVDVIMIGEMRTHQTMAAAVTAAETGHLVFSTLHTNNASQTIDRIVDSFEVGQQDQIRAQLANGLIGIFSQRLVPRIAGGLIPVFELLINTPAVSNLIREKRTHEIDILIETGSELGMIDLNRSLAELIRRGEISIEAARQVAINPKALERLL